MVILVYIVFYIIYFVPLYLGIRYINYNEKHFRRIKNLRKVLWIIKFYYFFIFIAYFIIWHFRNEILSYSKDYDLLIFSTPIIIVFNAVFAMLYLLIKKIIGKNKHIHINKNDTQNNKSKNN